MRKNPFRNLVVGEYKIENQLHLELRENPGQVQYITVYLSSKSYTAVKTVVQTKVTGMKSLHAAVARLRLQYTLRWGKDPDSVEIVKG